LTALSKVEDVRPILKSMNSVSMENDVNLEYGLQIINNMQQSDNSPDKNWEESDGDGD
jgi:hypothetical protein